MAVSVGFVVPIPAEGVELFYKISCPAVWPGPERGHFPLTYATQWKYWTESVDPTTEADFFDDTGPGDIQMDCAYGKGGQRSPMRVTLVLPGHPFRCALPTLYGNRKISQCEVRAGADGSLGEVRWRVAERVGPSTTFFGFGIGQSREQVFRAAERGNFFAEGESLSRIIMQRDDAHLSAIIDPETGLTTEIIWKVPETEDGRNAFLDEVVFRFGFNYEEVVIARPTPSSGISKTVWKGLGEDVAVELRPDLSRGIADSLHLVRLTSGGATHQP